MKKVIYGLISFAPALAFAQATSANLGFLEQLVRQVGRAVAALIPVIFGLAIVYFFWGLAKYVRSAGDPKTAAEGKSIMIYGVIAIAVMISLYGIVYWLQGVVGIGSTAAPQIPTVPGL